MRLLLTSSTENRYQMLRHQQPGFAFAISRLHVYIMCVYSLQCHLILKKMPSLWQRKAKQKQNGRTPQQNRSCRIFCNNNKHRRAVIIALMMCGIRAVRHGTLLTNLIKNLYALPTKMSKSAARIHLRVLNITTHRDEALYLSLHYNK